MRDNGTVLQHGEDYRPEHCLYCKHARTKKTSAPHYSTLDKQSAKSFREICRTGAGLCKHRRALLSPERNLQKDISKKSPHHDRHTTPVHTTPPTALITTGKRLDHAQTNNSTSARSQTFESLRPLAPSSLPTAVNFAFPRVLWQQYKQQSVNS